MKERIVFDKSKGLRFLLVGVGGQGTILASDIIAEVGLALGYDVKKAEIHGMSQRGGSVVTNLRWGDQVFSPIVPKSNADILVAFEKLEAARFADYLRKDGLALINNYAIPPVTVNSGSVAYPVDEEIAAVVRQITPHVYWVEGMGIAENLGNARMANVVMIGALSRLLDLPIETVLASIASRVPAKYVDLNRQAFLSGYEVIAIPS